MFFRLEGSVDNKVIGNVNSQYQDANYGGDIQSPLFLSNVFLEDVDLDKIVVPYPIINKGAKITDLIWGTCYGNSLRLLISDKLKNILEQADNPTLKFIKTHITHKKIIYPNYWFTHPLGFQMEVINFDSSKCIVQGLGASFLRDIKINDFSDFKKLNENLIMPERLSIIQPVFHPNKLEIIILEKVKAGVSYYVSEKMKKEIENVGCTGIEFEPIEVA